jgi:hypothetical protein
MKKIAIQGSLDPKKQKEIIKILKSLGGENARCYDGNSPSYYYYIGNKNIIEMAKVLSSQEYELLTLKKYKEKYMNSETKELKIEIPKGYEVDKDKSTFEKIVFKKVEEKLTYTKIVNELFTGKRYYYTNDYGTIKESADPQKVNDFCDTDPNNAPTKHQLQRLLALNKLMNVAYYLNNGWEPDWNDNSQRKYFIYYDSNDKAFVIDYNTHFNYSVVYFKSIEIAEQAIEILGDEIIKLVLGI